MIDLRHARDAQFQEKDVVIRRFTCKDESMEACL